MTTKPKLTGQQEIFAREFVRCGVGAEAYRIAYPVKGRRRKLDDGAEPTRKPETEWEEASRLLANPKVSARIRDMWDAEAEVVVGELVNGLRISRTIATVDRNPAAITGAVTALGKLKGFFKDDPSKAGDIHLHFDMSDKSVL